VSSRDRRRRSCHRLLGRLLADRGLGNCRGRTTAARTRPMMSS